MEKSLVAALEAFFQTSKTPKDVLPLMEEAWSEYTFKHGEDGDNQLSQMRASLYHLPTLTSVLTL